MNKQADFIRRLQKEARAQQKLYNSHFFPSQLDIITSYIGRNSWQVILIGSLITSLVIEAWRTR